MAKATGIIFGVQGPMGVTKMPYGSFAGKVQVTGWAQKFIGISGASGATLVNGVAPSAISKIIGTS